MKSSAGDSGIDDGSQAGSSKSIDKNNIKHFTKVQSYNPGSTLLYDNDRAQVLKLKLPSVNLGVFGGIGAGKSCFINSIESVLSGEYRDHAGENRMERMVDDDAAENCPLQSSTTADRVKIRVSERICLVDNRGLPKKCSEGIAEEIVKQCDGTRKFGSFVPENWNNTAWQRVKDSLCGTFCRRRSLKQRIHCAILVYSLQDDVEPREFKVIIDALRKACGRFPLIVLTSVDQVTEDVKHRRWAQFQSLHCPRIFAIKNYTMRDCEARRLDTDTTLVDILYNVCVVSDQNFLQVMEDSSGMCC